MKFLLQRLLILHDTEKNLSLRSPKFLWNFLFLYNAGSFDVVMAISVFGPNTVNHTALYEINRIIKPGRVEIPDL